MNATAGQAAAEARAERRKIKAPRTHVSIDVDVDVSEVLDELSVDDLSRALEAKSDFTMLAVFEEFQRRGDAPQCLKDYIYEHLGRVL